jgi:hypothetical protein
MSGKPTTQGKVLAARASFQCTYARAWVQVKHYYGLTVDSAEKSALSSILSGC